MMHAFLNVCCMHSKRYDASIRKVLIRGCFSPMFKNFRISGSIVCSQLLHSFTDVMKGASPFEILISSSRVEIKIWVSRGEREIKSSYFFRVEIEISKKDVLLTCKWLFFIQTHFYYRTHVYLKMNENFNITLGNREKKEKNFFPLSKIESRKRSCLPTLKNRE